MWNSTMNFVVLSFICIHLLIDVLEKLNILNKTFQIEQIECEKITARIEIRTTSLS